MALVASESTLPRLIGTSSTRARAVSAADTGWRASGDKAVEGHYRFRRIVVAEPPAPVGGLAIGKLACRPLRFLGAQPAARR